MTCQCKVCVRNRAILDRARNISPEAEQLVMELLDQMIEIEFDLDVHKALVEGTWENADEIIRRRRNK